MYNQLAVVLAAATLLPSARAQSSFAWIRNAPNTHETLAIKASPLGGAVHLALGGNVGSQVRLEQVDVNGDLDWRLDLPTSVPFPQLSAKLAVDAAGRSALLLQDDSEVSLRVFDAEGELEWTRTLLPLAGSGDFFTALNLRYTEDGELLTLTASTAGTELRRFDAMGTELAPFTVQGAVGGFSTPLHVDDAGKIYFATRSVPGNLQLWRLNPDGTPDGSRPLPVSTNSQLVAIDVDATGDIYVVTNGGAMGRHDLRQITAALGLGWSSAWNSPSNSATAIVGLLCMADGSVLAYGKWLSGPYYRRYDTSGNEMEIFDFPKGGRLLDVVERPDHTAVLLGWRADPQPTGPDQRVLLRTVPLQGAATTELLDNGVHSRQESQAFAIDTRGDLIVSVLGRFSGAPGERNMLWKLSDRVVPSTPLCSPAQPNSTGVGATLEALGSEATADDNLTLVADDLPLQTTAFFLASMGTGFTSTVPGSQGSLCLAGSIGRYVRSGEVRTSSETGSASLLIPLDDTPQPTMSVPVLAGQSWAFQAWFRDANPGPTSNFTNAIVVDFL